MKAAPPTSSSPAPEHDAPFFDRLLAVLLLAPGILLAFPGPHALLWFDPFPRLAGAGGAAMAAVPVAVLLCWRPAAIARARDIRGGLLLALLLYQGLAFVTLGGAADTFEARRALILAVVTLVLLLGAGHLGPEGRRWFTRGVMLLSILWTGFALAYYVFAAEGHLAGVLGNPGPLSQAALPGAAIGAWIVMRQRGRWFVPALLALGLFLAHAAVASVNAALVSILVILLLGAWRVHGETADPRARRLPWLLAGLTLLGAVGMRAADGLGAGAEVTEEIEAADGGGIEGGIEVRLRIWGRLPALLASAPIFGVGPGQFEADFPPFRDPREAVISRHGVCSEQATEVEHPHNDWLHGIVQYGLVGGALWLIFLLLTLRAGLRGTRHVDEALSVAGAAAVALLVNALFHAPLLVSPASAVLAFPLFGLLLEEDGRDAPRFNRVVLTRVVGALGLLAAWAAIPLVQHGRATSDYVRASRTIERLAIVGAGEDTEALQQASREARRAAARAYQAAPYSIPAGILRARFMEGNEVLATIRAALEHRPHSFVLLEEKGYLLARAERFDDAREAWLAALALDPSHPRILRSLARLEMTTGQQEKGHEYVMQLRANGCLDPSWLETLGTELLLTGRIEAGLNVLAETDPRLRIVDAAFADALSKEAKRDGNERLADALRTLAHLRWAREHVEGADFATAVRSYRQALTPSRRYMEGGAVVLRLEMAAAEWRAGREDDARRTVEGLHPTPAEKDLLPAWAKQTLTEGELLDDDQ